MPQLGSFYGGFSFPRGYYYKGFEINSIKVPEEIYAFPVDLDTEDFEVWRNGIKFTIRLNRENKVEEGRVIYSNFDFVKAEFYGELLSTEKIDDYITLKPKGD